MNMIELAQSPAPSVAADATASSAAIAMKDARAGALVVLDDGKLAGVLSERDLVRRVVGEGRDPKTTKVREVMTKDVVAIAADSDLKSAFELMATRQVRHLVVADAEGRPAGLLSLRSLAEARIDVAREEIRTLRQFAEVDSLGG